MLLDLLNFDTQNSDESDQELMFRGETLDLLKFVENRLKNKGINVSIMQYEVESKKKDANYTIDKRGNLIAYSDNPNDLPTVILQGHVDTVPIGDFNGNPFGEIKRNFIFGRGSNDMKGPVASMIVAFEEIIKSPNRVFNPILLLTSDEEARNFEGIRRFLLENKIKIEFAICGEPSNMRIFNKFKGATSRSFKIIGKSAHGARPDLGKNAIYDSIEILKLLRDFSDYSNKFIKNDNFSGEEYSSKSTLNVGKIIGGNKVNSVPDKCIIEFELRLIDNIERYEKELKERVFDKIPEGVEYSVNEQFTFNPLIISEKNIFIEKLSKILNEKNLKEDFGIMNEFSEATLLNLNNITTIVFGPGDPKYSHSSEEQIDLTLLEDYKDILIKFFL